MSIAAHSLSSISPVRAKPVFAAQVAAIVPRSSPRASSGLARLLHGVHLVAPHNPCFCP